MPLDSISSVSFFIEMDYCLSGDNSLHLLGPACEVPNRQQANQGNSQHRLPANSRVLLVKIGFVAVHQGFLRHNFRPKLELLLRGFAKVRSRMPQGEKGKSIPRLIGFARHTVEAVNEDSGRPVANP